MIQTEITIDVVQPTAVTYSVTVSPSVSSDLPISQYVNFTVNVVASNGENVSGSATLYLLNGSGTVWGTFGVPISNGTGSTGDLEPGLYLQAGYDTEYYYAVFDGAQSATGELTFVTSTNPTQMTLSGDTSVTAGEDVDFGITSNGSNVAVTLYVYNSQDNADNAPSLTGQLASYPVTLNSSGSGSTTLSPTAIAPDTYWVAYYNGVLSNVLEVAEQVEPPTSITLSASGSVNDMTFTVTSQENTDFNCSLYVYSSKSAAENVPSLTGQLAEFPDEIPVKNGSGSIALAPSVINGNAQYWVAYYSPSGLMSNILTVQG